MPPTKAELAIIHIAKKELGLTEEAYRDILYVHFHVQSAKQLTTRQAAELIDLFIDKGWKPRKETAGHTRLKHSSQYIEIKPGPAARQQRKVLALWHELGYDMNKIHTRVKKQFGVDRFEWLEDGKALHILITDLEHRLNTQKSEKK